MNVLPDMVRTDVDLASSRDQQWGIMTVFGVARRRSLTILGCLLGCLALAALYVWTAPSLYTATSVLVVDTKLAPPNAAQTGSETVVDPSVVETELATLESDRIGLSVIDRLKLAEDPEFVPTGPDWKARLMAMFSVDTPARSSGDTRRLSALNVLKRVVKVTRTGHSYLAEIAATTGDPEKSARIANAVADAFIQDQLDSRLQSNDRAAAWMRQRVDEVRAEADRASGALQTYLTEQAAGQTPANPGGQPGSTTDANPDRAGGTPLDPRRQQLEAAAQSKRGDYEALLNRYTRLTQFWQQQSFPATESRVLTVAQPPLGKSTPKSTVIFILSAVGGLTLGFAAALARDMLDHRLRRPEQIVKTLGLPFAGSLPLTRSLATAAQKTGTPSLSRFESLLRGGPRSNLPVLFDSRRPWCRATQTLRTVKFIIDRSVRRTSGTVVGITSANAGEGKTTVARNLAQLFSETGARVLVIDADFAKPDLSAIAARQNAAGLADVLAGTAKVEDCITATPFGFDLAGGGAPAMLHPFEILGSTQMQQVIATAQQTYHYVLLDLPSLLSSVDAQAVARFVDAFVFVIECGRTRFDSVEHALATSDIVADRTVATVLNKASKLEKTSDRAWRSRQLARSAMT